MAFRLDKCRTLTVRKGKIALQCFQMEEEIHIEQCGTYKPWNSARGASSGNQKEFGRNS